MIQTSYSNTVSPQKPPKVDRDVYGVQLTPGLKIAFNKSGNVVKGEIVELKRSEWKKRRMSKDGMYYWWSLRFELTVVDLYGNQSKINNPNSVSII